MTSQTDTHADTDAAVAHLREHETEQFAQLDEFLRIESVSADPGRADEVRRAAQWIADELTRIGVERATIHETTHHPIVTAEWMKAGAEAPTVLVYCHYDVQPPDPLDEWVRPPFEPRHEDDRVYARGAGDDKGQLFMHLKAVEAWMRTAGRLPVNLRFFFEGDEEVGFNGHRDVPYSYETGSRTMNSLPLPAPALRASIVPPWPSTSSRAMCSPRP